MTTRLAALAGFACLAGCTDPNFELPAPPDTAPDPFQFGSRFNPLTTGNVTGSVAWSGERPAVPTLRLPRTTRTGSQWVDLPNPNSPRVAPDGGLAGVVVYLKGLTPAETVPWNHPTVSVRIGDDDITVQPGGRFGFTPLGHEVELRSGSDALLGVRGRHADFFTLMLPDRGSVRWRFARPGRVELTSPANVHWAVADLFVCEHPYYTRTDEHGRFRFADVPPGEYDLVCRVPNWAVAATERDPETGAVFRTRYAPAAEPTVQVRVAAKATADVRIDVSMSSFPAAR